VRYTGCMRRFRSLVAAALVAASVCAPPLAAQDSAASIKQELERIKKTHPQALFPAQGAEDASGTTTLRLENASSLDVVVLIVGPTTERIELGTDRMRALTVAPGDYEIAVVAVTRIPNVPALYGRQTVTPNLRFSLKFVIPGI
jgi:hypothetical protein